MEELRKKAQALLQSGAVKVVIGYAAGSDAERARAVFVRKPEDLKQLIWDQRCRQNLATYLIKPEVKAFGKAAVVAKPSALRTIMQYAAESQMVDEAVVMLAVAEGNGQVTELANLAAIEAHLANLPRGLTPEQLKEIDKFSQMPLGERQKFWAAEMGRCIKCYACRAACPMCYCNRCITEVNQPQWVPVVSDALGNLEWNVARAMHLAGRCVDCGSCSDACPEGIRLDLLNRVLAQEAMTQFGAVAGLSPRKEYALSSFKPDDKEEFIR